ncbi:hypothetical protein Landi51_02915 [Colletotrichum acutatum]
MSADDGLSSQIVDSGIEAEHADDALRCGMYPGNGSYECSDYYRKLVPAVEQYVPRVWPGRSGPAPVDWQSLSDKLANAEAESHESSGGRCSEVFGSWAVKIGEHSDAINPWLDLIPNEFGLCVIKSAFAILLLNAKTYVDKRDKIVDAFKEIRQTINQASPIGGLLCSEPSVNALATYLYEGIVDAIHDLLKLSSSWTRTTPRDPSLSDSTGPKESRVRRTFQNTRLFLKRETPNRHQSPGSSQDASGNSMTLQSIVDEVRSKAGEFSRGIELYKIAMARDTHTGVETIGRLVDYMRRYMEQMSSRISSLDAQQEEQKREIRYTHERYYTAILRLTEGLNRIIEEKSRGSPRKFGHTLAPQWMAPKAIVSLDRLLMILLAPSGAHLIPSNGHFSLDLSLLEMCIEDSQAVLGAQLSIPLQTLSQANSILREERFRKWLRQSQPDMIVVDSNIESCAADQISPMSVLCANFGLALARRDKAKWGPRNVFTHFYCGLNADPHSGNWFGPVGMMRSLSLQLIVFLNQREGLSLDFLNNGDVVRDLERHDLTALCELFYDLLQQFDVDTTIYCFVDGMMHWDSGLGDVSLSVKLIQNIQGIVKYI